MLDEEGAAAGVEESKGGEGEESAKEKRAEGGREEGGEGRMGGYFGGLSPAGLSPLPSPSSSPVPSRRAFGIAEGALEAPPALMLLAPIGSAKPEGRSFRFTGDVT